MKALMPLKKPRLSATSEKLIRHQVSVECQNVCRTYEILEDVCWLYAISQVAGYRKKRLERIYKQYWKLRDEVQDFVRADGEDNSLEDGLRELYMSKILKGYGVDIDDLYNTFGKNRIDYTITD